MRLEAPSGEHVIQARRVAAARRIAPEVDTVEERKAERLWRTLPPKAAKLQALVTRVVIHHLALEGLVLGALGRGQRVAIRPIRSRDDLGVAEQEQPVGGSCDGGRLTWSDGVYRELLGGFHLGLEIGRHEVPDLSGVHLRAELGCLPAADVVVRRIHAGLDSRRGGEERQPRLTGAIGQIIMVDADDAVLEGLAISELNRPLRPSIHRGLRLGVGGRHLALGGDVLGNCLLLTEGPVLRVSFASLASAAWTVAEPAPLPLPEPLGSQVPPAVPFTNTPATVLNWFVIADETHGPAIGTTRTMIAMISTYSTVDCPFGRRVNLGDTPPRKEFPLHACAAPLGLLRLMLQRIDAITKDESTMPQRHSH